MKMASKLPGEESKRNGLFDISRALVEQPDKPLVCIVVLDSSQTLLDHDKHTKEPTIRIQHIEPMRTISARREAVELLTDAYRARTTEQLEFDYDIDLGVRRDAIEF